MFGHRDHVELLGMTGPGPAVERNLAGSFHIERDGDLALGHRVLLELDVFQDCIREDRSRVHGVDQEQDGQRDERADDAEVSTAIQVLPLDLFEFGDLAGEREGWRFGRACWRRRQRAAAAETWAVGETSEWKGGRRSKKKIATETWAVGEASGLPWAALRLASGLPWVALRLASGLPWVALRLVSRLPWVALRLA